jgi:hypothetical protein
MNNIKARRSMVYLFEGKLYNITIPLDNVWELRNVLKSGQPFGLVWECFQMVIKNGHHFGES